MGIQAVKEQRLAAELPRRLLAWYATAQRDLPWRRSRTPYRVWLSEVMLQQTRVDTVVPYYRRFLRRFPTLKALAQAPLDEVLKLWAGLGYYARARNLHAAARQVVTKYGGRIPRSLEPLLALPGVGDYTAGAILSIAYNLRAAVLDGNVARVLCRLLGIAENPKASATQTRLRAIAEALIPEGHARDLNQAMMELGAVVCTPRTPTCEACPVSGLCVARRAGKQRQLPRTPRRKPVPHYDVGIGLVWRRSKLLITRRPLDAMLGGLWEFPGGKREGDEPLEQTVQREIREELGLDVAVAARFLSCNHAYSHFRVTLHAFHCTSPRGRPRPVKSTAYRWVTVAELPGYPFPAGSLKIIRELEKHPGPPED
jgi:A/G-specific adenine glycosylase